MTFDHLARFVNTFDSQLECTYFAPKHPAFAVDGLDAEIVSPDGSRCVIRGVLKPTRQAEKEYMDAIANQQTAVLAQK